jgi:hypothetical protein
MPSDVVLSEDAHGRIGFRLRGLLKSAKSPYHVADDRLPDVGP